MGQKGVEGDSKEGEGHSQLLDASVKGLNYDYISDVSSKHKSYPTVHVSQLSPIWDTAFQTQSSWTACKTPIFLDLTLRFWFGVSQKGLRICIADKFPAVADTLGLWTHLDYILDVESLANVCRLLDWFSVETTVGSGTSESCFWSWQIDILVLLFLLYPKVTILRWLF